MVKITSTRVGAAVAQMHLQWLKESKDVITDRLTEYTCEYPCDAPTQRRWFRLSCTALVSDSGREVIVAHHDITALKNGKRKCCF